MNRIGACPALGVAVVLGAALAPANQDAGSVSPFQVRYRVGEKTTYHMTASNKDVHRDLRYEADATGTVSKNPDGVLVEDFEWTKLVVNEKAVELPMGTDAIHQILSRDPSFPLSVPDMSKIPPILIGPVTDLLTFYVDLQLAARGAKLVHAGDHFYFEHGTPASWADGTTVCVGEDSIDFDVSLSDVNASKGTATTVVRHVPPAKPRIRKVADWTSVAVADTPNNWIQVVNMGPEGYLGQVGKETFDVRLTTSLTDGHLSSATLDNVVDVLERPSKSRDLSMPGAESRYKIVRKIEMHETTEKAKEK